MELPTREVIEIDGYVCIFDIQRSEYRESTVMVLRDNTRYVGILPSNFRLVPDNMHITRRNNTLVLDTGSQVYRLRTTGLGISPAGWICVLLFVTILVGFLGAPTDMDLYTQVIRQQTRRDTIPDVIRSLSIGSVNMTQSAWTLESTIQSDVGNEEDGILHYVIGIICLGIAYLVLLI